MWPIKSLSAIISKCGSGSICATASSSNLCKCELQDLTIIPSTNILPACWCKCSSSSGDLLGKLHESHEQVCNEHEEESHEVYWGLNLWNLRTWKIHTMLEHLHPPPLVWASASVDQSWVVIRSRNRLLTVIKVVLRIHSYDSQINPKTWVWYMITVLQRTENKIKWLAIKTDSSFMKTTGPLRFLK